MNREFWKKARVFGQIYATLKYKYDHVGGLK